MEGSLVVSPPRQRTLRARASAAAAGLLVLVPKAKLLLTAGTAVASIAAYSLFFGWWFAAGLVVLLLIHEMGHVIALRREGIAASPPMFIPFLGAVITARSLGDDAAAEARVGLGGPVLGTLGAFGALALYGLTGDPLLKGLAYVGFLLNLFNLLPVVPLDGGRAMAAMTPWMWFAGLGLLAYLTFTVHGGILPIILILAVFETYRRVRDRDRSYYKVRPRQRVAIGAVYLLLVAVLAVAMHATYVHYPF
ncbi:MAG TPA: site-2 protease family protein [Solirubrobacteraceae bacterium]|jgi:Zn-dependent protease|nr:site-2 protease family protein [Solirubrobacteraceae bacterium]